MSSGRARDFTRGPQAFDSDEKKNYIVQARRPSPRKGPLLDKIEGDRRGPKGTEGDPNGDPKWGGTPLQRAGGGEDTHPYKYDRGVLHQYLEGGVASVKTFANKYSKKRPARPR